ncbi:MAG: glycerol-3-phosphate dehydrogenase subunit GlpB [Deltaproteobacteria bacterium]|nr:glycerol-3-phosphate dehydrogenase subunit GlpB [Deltaproteobacteria bacterium]
MTYSENKKVDLVVVGAGLAGMAAALFALESGLKTVLLGSTAGEMFFASGALDLLGIHPIEQQKRWEKPWVGISSLIEDCPEHPYARLGLENIRNGWNKFLDILRRAELGYRGWPERNIMLATCAGTFKITHQVPETMWPGVIGFKEKLATLIIGFEGMKDFSAVQMVNTLRDRWPGLRAQRLKFPYPLTGVERQNVFMAEALTSPEVLAKMAKAIISSLEREELVGVPAILGLRQSQAVTAELERQIGVPVFEIPTMPPSVPGLRLRDAIEQELLRLRAVLMQGGRAVAINQNGRKCLDVVVQSGQSQEAIGTRGIVLATGRFLGGGLVAGRNGIREALLDLPVYQPEKRKDWHLHSFLDPRGHPVNRAGLEVDDLLRPLGPDGRCACENLFVAGSLLAHQDWKRMKCGSGLAIATAYGAVQSFTNHC